MQQMLQSVIIVAAEEREALSVFKLEAIRFELVRLVVSAGIGASMEVFIPQQVWPFEVVSFVGPHNRARIS